MNDKELDKILDAVNDIEEAQSVINARIGEIGMILSNLPSRYWKVLKVPPNSIRYAAKMQDLSGRRD